MFVDNNVKGVDTYFFLQKREKLRFIKGEKGLSGGRKIADGR